MDATTEGEAVAIAERKLVSLHGVALPHGKARISAGVAAGAGGVHALWLAADEALSKAKKDGRDRVVIAGTARSRASCAGAATRARCWMRSSANGVSSRRCSSRSCC